MSMIDKADQKRLMIRYLYGELPADESSQFEDTYLEDNEIFHELIALENEIVDQYVVGELTGKERERFENSLPRFPARREAIETARTLLAYSAAAENELLSSGAGAPEKYRTIGRYWHWSVQAAAAAISVAIISVMVWLVVQNRRLDKELEALRHDQGAATQDKKILQRQIDNLQIDLRQRDNALQQMAQSLQLEHLMVSLTLDSGVIRETGELPTLLIPSRAAYVMLRMAIADDASPHYSISIRTPDSRLVLRTDYFSSIHNFPGVHAQEHKEITITVPAQLLQNGDYVVRVSSGKEDLLHNVAGYSFHVIRP